MDKTFKIGDLVCLGASGGKGKIVNTWKPFGTYTMYTVHMLTDGSFVTAAKHQLVKGMDDDEFTDIFQEMRSQSLSNYTIDLSTLDTLLRTTSTATNPTSTLPTIQPSTTTNQATPNFVFETNTSFTNMYTSPVDLPTDDTTSLNPPSPPPNRFNQVTDAEVDAFIFENENGHTRRKTLGHIKLFQQFLSGQNESREIHQIPSAELDPLLAKFFIGVRNKDGGEYEPSYLRSMLGSFQRYLKRHKYEHCLINGVNFAKTRDALTCKQKDLKKKGKGNLPNAAAEIEDHEIDKLYSCGQLGNSTPKSLINTLWFNNTLYFGMRGGGEEHRGLCWGDIQLCFDHKHNLEYLKYNERQTKTRTGVDLKNIRDPPPVMYATPSNPSRCPVETYKCFKEHRPISICKTDDPFYITPVTNNKHPKQNDKWFLNGPVGRNTIQTLMKTMAKAANLDGFEQKRITNSSVRKHLCQKLLDNNVDDSKAVHITGHKNPNSLNNYRKLKNDQQQHMSAILSSTDINTVLPEKNLNNKSNPIDTCTDLILHESSIDDFPVSDIPNVDEVRPRVLPPMAPFAPEVQHSDTLSHPETNYRFNVNNISNSAMVNPNDTVQGLFYKSTIMGGNFTINFNFGSPAKKPRTE